MKQETRRIMVSIPPDLAQRMDTVKRELFYNKPYSEVFRYIFSLGLKAADAREKAENECCEAAQAVNALTFLCRKSGET